MTGSCFLVITVLAVLHLHLRKQDTLAQCQINAVPTVYDAGPTLRPHWVNVSWLLCVCFADISTRTEYSRFLDPDNITRHSPDVISMLGQRCRQWPNIDVTSGECLLSLWILKISNTRHLPILGQCWASVADCGPTLNKHCAEVFSPPWSW